MTYHIENTRVCIQSVAKAPNVGMKISWLTVICKQILNHLELSESAKPVTDHLIGARKSVTAASMASDAGSTIAWLTDACEQILNHLESQQGDNKLPQGEMDERPEPKTDQRLQILLDQTHDPCVGIHLLDGQPHVVRDGGGIVWAPVVQATLYRGGKLIAMWVEDADQ